MEGLLRVLIGEEGLRRTGGSTVERSSKLGLCSKLKRFI
jgi:hypothetical protein